MPGPLHGIKIVEFAGIGPGPFCGMLLADMGADVIKVEKLPGGDDTRSYTEPSIAGESAAFMTGAVLSINGGQYMANG